MQPRVVDVLDGVPNDDRRRKPITTPLEIWRNACRLHTRLCVPSGLISLKQGSVADVCSDHMNSPWRLIKSEHLLPYPCPVVEMAASVGPLLGICELEPV